MMVRTFVSASRTSVTFPESPHLPRSHFHPEPSEGKMYSSRGRSFTWGVEGRDREQPGQRIIQQGEVCPQSSDPSRA